MVLLESLSSDEWADWLVWRKHFPSPQMRGDVNAALIRSSALAPHMKNAPRIRELLPRYGERRKAKNSEDLKFLMRAWTGT